MDGSASDDNTDFITDDAFSMICGDLGLGENSRSSASLRYELEMLGDSYSDLLHTQKQKHQSLASSGTGISDEIKLSNSQSRSSSVEESSTADKNTTKQKTVSKDKSIRRKANSKTSSKSGDEENGCGSDEKFPTYADVPFGTSLRQQRKLYEKNLGSLMKKHSNSFDADSVPTSESGTVNGLSSEEIDRKLISALEEVEELKQDLEVCKQRLDAKYNAITILKKQAEENNHERATNELKAKETSLKLAEEVNKLQFELQWRESSFQDSQQTWAQRFDRVCQENALLTAQLEARSEELRRANSQKLALRQERDELLALLDIKERTKYEKSHSRVEEEEFSQYSTTELAVLGACQCRGASKTEPCGCAYAAANLMREVYKLREESRLMLQRREEAYLTVDAYRLAFEEQLQKSRAMTQELAVLATTTSRTVKAKAAVKWLLAVLGDDDYPRARSGEGGEDGHHHDKTGLESLTLPELVSVLTDILHEKKEQLVHQKLASQILSARLQETERKLESLTEADGDVPYD